MDICLRYNQLWQDCRRNRKNCFFAWVNLRNAFGSISHEAIYTTLKHMGFSEQFIELVKDIYTNAEKVGKLFKIKKQILSMLTWG